TAAKNITGAGSVKGTSVALKATGDIGASGSGNQFLTTAGTLALNAANAYVSNSGAVVLANVTPSTGAVSNTVTGAYELTDNNSITVTGANVGGGTLTALTKTRRAHDRTGVRWASRMRAAA